MTTDRPIRPTGTARVAEYAAMKKLAAMGIKSRSTWQLLDDKFADLPWVRDVAPHHGVELPELVDQRAHDDEERKRRDAHLTVDWILGAPADMATRHCVVAGCSEPARRKSSTCSPRHARAAQRARFEAAKRSDGPALPALPDPAPTATNDPPSPGVSRPDIADTADNSATPEKRCANCGLDISSKRAGAVVCGDTCRKQIARRARKIAAAAELSDVLGQPTLFDVDTGGRL